MGINVLRVELVREIGNLKTYKITYQEETEVETTLIGNTFNHSEEEDMETIKTRGLEEDFEACRNLFEEENVTENNKADGN